MSAVGKGADGTLAVAAFVGGQVVQPYATTAFPGTTNQTAYDEFVALDSPLYRGANSGSSWDFEQVEWRVADYGPGDSSTLQTQTVSGTIDFAVAVTYGTPFDLGIFAVASAGEISSGPVNIANATSVDFSSTISWGGPGYILTQGGTGPAITDFTILANNGANFEAAATPEPATWTMMALGCLGAGTALRRRRVEPAGA